MNLLYILGLICFTFSITNSESSSWKSAWSDKIKYVVAIMMENRSFDHLIGYLRATRTEIDGCLPDITPSENSCSNPMDPDNPTENLVYVGSNSSYVQPGDPGHQISDTSFQVFGTNDPSDPRFNVYPPPMIGFVKDYDGIDQTGGQGAYIMQCFTPDKVPIITTLANEFGLFDRWFADVPGPTDPNRLYSWIATSDGMGANDEDRLEKGFTETSIFELLDKETQATLDWKLYFEDSPTPIFLDYVRKFPKRFHSMDDFYVHAMNGNLSTFSWLDPRYNTLVDFPATDQHPDHDVTDGEKLLKRVYESVRNGPKWNETLLLIFYDEHGGFFDHVSPPKTLNPDNTNTSDVTPQFDFDRLGIRIPAVLVSPYIQKGTLANRPDSSSLNQYSHSSLVHTMREQFLPSFANTPLTKRDEISLTFEDMVNLDEPRTDCPTTLPDVPSGVSKTNWNAALQPVSDTQYNMLIVGGTLCNTTKEEIDNNYAINQDTAGKFMIRCMNQWLGREVVYSSKRREENL